MRRVNANGLWDVSALNTASSRDGNFRSGFQNAVHLYESVGFTHVPAEKLPEMHYARADVFMQMEL